LRVLPERFVEILRSIDLERIDARRITAPTTLIGVQEDVLVPPPLLIALAELIGPQCSVEIVSSPHGHDAFIEDPGCIAGIVTRALRAAEVLA
jgi:homoserine O-acetyltransferase